MTARHDIQRQRAGDRHAGARRRGFPLIICLVAVARLCAQEYIVMEETWRPGGVSGWSAPARLLALSAAGGGGHSGALRGQFAQQGFPFPDSDAFTANSGSSLGKFAHDYFAAGRRIPLWMGFDLKAGDVLPSSCLVRLTGGAGSTNTFFRSVLPQLAAAGAWNWVEVPLDSVAGWSGGTAAQFTNVLENVTGVELRLTRNGMAAQDYLLDNFTVVWRIADALADADGDGLPDSYELAHTGSATALSPGEDDDGDGMPNGSEFDAGSDPRDAGSALSIVRILKQEGGLAQLVVRSLSGRSYRVERAADLTRDPAPDWQPAGALTPGNGSRLTLADPDAPAGACFYRVWMSR